MRTLRTTTTTLTGGLLLGGIIMAGPASAQDNENCDDFASQAEAQAHYQEDVSDPDQLDADDDDIACENFPDYTDPARNEVPVDRTGGGGEPTPAPPVDNSGSNGGGPTEPTEPGGMVMPTGPVDTGAGGTAGPDNTGLIAAGGIALTVGAGGLLLMHRRSTARN